MKKKQSGVGACGGPDGALVAGGWRRARNCGDFVMDWVARTVGLAFKVHGRKPT